MRGGYAFSQVVDIYGISLNFHLITSSSLNALSFCVYDSKLNVYYIVHNNVYVWLLCVCVYTHFMHLTYY